MQGCIKSTDDRAVFVSGADLTRLGGFYATATPSRTGPAAVRAVIDGTMTPNRTYGVTSGQARIMRHVLQSELRLGRLVPMGDNKPLRIRIDTNEGLTTLREMLTSSRYLVALTPGHSRVIDLIELRRTMPKPASAEALVECAATA